MPPYSIAVAIATAGRRDVLTATLAQLARQTRLPDVLAVCPAQPEDLDRTALAAFPGKTLVVTGARGSSHQRNAILRAVPGSDLVAFFDDDFFPQPDYLAAAERAFAETPDLVVATGRVLADGIHGPGIAVEDAKTILAEDSVLPNSGLSTPTFSGYGCNMVVRHETVLAQAVEFDERLPLYGWWEDVDFCRRLAPHGRIARFEDMRGVHLGSKRGRSPGRQLGYSQVANLVYMMGKGTVPRSMGIKQILRNIVANAVYSAKPEPWIDRRGRLRGNMRAVVDSLAFRLTPEKATRV